MKTQEGTYFIKELENEEDFLEYSNSVKKVNWRFPNNSRKRPIQWENEYSSIYDRWRDTEGKEE